MKTDAPLYAIHNKYILSGYRTRSTFKDALRSVFKKHNETTNIWTHLIGMIFFFTFLVNVKEPNESANDTRDVGDGSERGESVGVTNDAKVARESRHGGRRVERGEEELRQGED